MLVSTVLFLFALTTAVAQEGTVCVCVDASQCLNGQIRDEKTVKDASPDDFHNGEGLISERIRTCDWEQVCCAVPPHLQIPGQPSAPPPPPKESPDRSSEEDISKEDISKEDISKVDISKEDISKEDISKEDVSKEDPDDLDLPRVDDLKGCGVRRRAPLALPIDLRISGLKGPKNTFYGEAPWMARILGDNGFVCGGTLLNPRVVLTAAHCLKRVKGQKLMVEVGEWNTASKKEPLPPQRLEASKVVKHPDFNSKNLKNDVALVFFRSRFNLSETVDIICTPESEKDVNGESCMAVGWGKTEQSNSAPYQSILRKVHLPLMDRDTCESRLKETRLGPKFRLPSGFVCAGGTVEGDTCAGDGGGPLYCPMTTDSNRMAIVGVTAWGIDCGKGHPAVFASVPHQTSWIYSTISDELDDD